MTNIESIKTDYQHIRLEGERDGVALYQNDVFRFSSEGTAEILYAILATIPMAMSAKVEVTLILGGGDGMAARSALPFSGTILVVDRDPALISLSKRPPLSELNSGSLSRCSVQTIIGEVVGAIGRMKRGIFDVVIVDLAVPEDANKPREFAAGFYDICMKRLAPGGILSVRVPGKSKASAWLLQLLEKKLGNSACVSVDLSPRESVDVIYGSGCPLRLVREAVGAPAGLAERVGAGLTGGQKVIPYGEAKRSRTNA